MIPGPSKVTEPHKELRFTRAVQAAQFAVLGAVLCGSAAALLALNIIPDRAIIAWWWALVPLPPAALLFLLAGRCVRHAYIILTPLGIELFPFFRPEKNLRVIYWNEIADAEIDERNHLVLHFDEEKRSGVVASLAPIPAARRELLARAIAGRMEER